MLCRDTTQPPSAQATTWGSSASAVFEVDAAPLGSERWIAAGTACHLRFIGCGPPLRRTAAWAASHSGAALVAPVASMDYPVGPEAPSRPPTQRPRCLGWRFAADPFSASVRVAPRV